MVLKAAGSKFETSRNPQDEDERHDKLKMEHLKEVSEALAAIAMPEYIEDAAQWEDYRTEQDLADLESRQN